MNHSRKRSLGRPSAVGDGADRRGFNLARFLGSVATWKLAAVVAGIFLLAIVGFFVGRLLPVTYTSEARLAVGASSLGNFSVPGYSQATQDLASNYARYVTSGQLQARGLERGSNAPAGSINSVEATPIPGSNIIRIIVQGSDRLGTARVAANLAKSLERQVNESIGSTDRILSELNTASRQLAVAQADVAQAERNLGAVRASSAEGGPAVTQAEQSLTAARTTFSVAQVKQESVAQRYTNSTTSQSSEVKLSTVREADVVSNSRGVAGQWGVAVGILIGLVLGVGYLWGIYRRDAVGSHGR